MHSTEENILFICECDEYVSFDESPVGGKYKQQYIYFYITVL